MNEIAAVVVAYNRRDLLRECVKSTLAQEGASCDVLVFDNESTDGTADMMTEEFGDDPRVQYFNTGDDLGSAGGLEVGIEHAVLSGYRYIWILDDDAQPHPTALSELLKAGEGLGDWGFLNSAVYWTDGSLCEANRPKANLFKRIGPDDSGQDPLPIVMGSFVSMLVPADVVMEVGLPIGEYFLWTGDYEFSGRISKIHQGYFVPKSSVTHAMRENTRASLATASADRLDRFYDLYRNDMHCYREHGIQGRVYLAAKAAYTIAEVLVKAKDDKAERLAEFARGTLDGLSFCPDVPRVRNKEANQRKDEIGNVSPAAIGSEDSAVGEAHD